MQSAASPENAKPFRAPHPLAVALMERLRGAALPVLDFACGSGRNSVALRNAGFSVVQIDDVTASSVCPFAGITGPFAGVISTHGLLHGTAAIVAENLRAIAERLAPGAALYATFGSLHDPRFGTGKAVDASTYAPLDGDEAGVPHTFFGRDALTALLESSLVIESLEEVSVDEVAGEWAHAQRPLSGAVHWFAIAMVSQAC